MTRDRHRSIGAPGIGRNVIDLVLFEDARRRKRIALAAENVNAIADCSGGNPTSRRRKGRERSPAVGDRVIHFESIDVARCATAGDVQPSANRRCCEMFARRRHRRENRPAIGEGIVRRECVSARISAGDVNASVDGYCRCGPARRRQRCHARPDVDPRIVAIYNRCRIEVERAISADHVNNVTDDRGGGVMQRLGQRRDESPSVRDRIVFFNGREHAHSGDAADGVDLSIGRRDCELLPRALQRRERNPDCGEKRDHIHNLRRCWRCCSLWCACRL